MRKNGINIRNYNIIDALDIGILRVGLHTIGIPDTEGRLITQDDIDAAFPREIGEVGDAWTYSESTVVIPEAASSSLILLCSISSLFIRRFFRA